MRVLTGMGTHSDKVQILFGLTCYNSCLFYISAECMYSAQACQHTQEHAEIRPSHKRHCCWAMTVLTTLCIVYFM